MRIFVTGTGRCGTSTFYQAVSHATNFTAGHESRAGRLEQHEYPDNHIEVSSQLVVDLPRLMSIYPDSRWVHLVRGKAATVESLANCCPDAMECYAIQWFQHQFAKHDRKLHRQQLLDTAEMYYNNVNLLVSSIFKQTSPDRAHTFLLHRDVNRWDYWWNMLELEGDLEASKQEWLKKYNAANNRGRDSFSPLEA